MSTVPSESRYVGTTSRGLTKEFTFPVPWGQVAGKTWGEEGKPPILCMHGWLDNCNSFDKLIPLLPQEYFYVALDTPGQGLSSEISQGMHYSTVFYCGVIKRLLDRFKFKSVTILGHSAGGNIGLYFASLYPEIVKRIIVLDSSGVWFRKRDENASALRQCIDSYLALENAEPRPPKVYTYEQARERLKAANSDLNDEAVDILLERGLEERGNGEFTFRRDIRHLYKDANERDFGVALAIAKNMKADALFIWAKDGLLPRFTKSHQNEFQGVLNTFRTSCNFQLVELEGNHHLHLCNPEEAAKQITKFLRDKEGNQSKEDSANL